MKQRPKWLDRWLIALIDGDPWRLEIVLGLYLMLYGGWLLLDINTFASSTTFAIMAQLGSEEAWGISLIAVSLLLFIAQRRRWKLRLMIVTLSFLQVGFIDSAMWLSGTTSTAPISFLAIELINAWILISLIGHGNNEH